MRRSVGNSIRELREEHELKQYALAYRLGLTKSTVSQYENGTRTPDLEIADKIASTFQVSLDYLCGVHDFKYNPRDEEFKSLMKTFDTCSQEEKKKIIKIAKQIREERK
mgnify:CR=1 FL=1